MKTLKYLLLLMFAILLSACGEEKSENYGKFSRDELRYYAYAPPLIPHEIINRKCQDCHIEGMVVEGYKTPVTPHPELVNCQQCHIYPDADVALFKKNGFVGVKEPVALNLPQPAGPPLIPHRVFMRENCVVCHNDPSRNEIVQTTHPERLNCTQCHVAQNGEVELFRKNTEIADAFD